MDVVSIFLFLTHPQHQKRNVQKHLPKNYIPAFTTLFHFFHFATTSLLNPHQFWTLLESRRPCSFLGSLHKSRRFHQRRDTSLYHFHDWRLLQFCTDHLRSFNFHSFCYQSCRQIQSFHRYCFQIVSRNRSTFTFHITDRRFYLFLC